MNPLKSWSLAICWTGLISTSLFAGSGSKLSEDLLVGDPDQPVDVIIKFKDAASDSNINKVASHGPKHKVSLNLLRSAAFNGRRRDLVDVANDPAVEAITPDYEIRGSAFSGSPDYGWMSALQLSSATGTLPYDGTGISVALIDSGINDDEDLKDAGGHNRIVYKQSFVPGDNHADDFYGHGMHVAGIIAGRGKHSTGSKYTYQVRGIAPNAKLVSLRVLDKNGSGTDSAVVAAIQKAIDLKSTYNIRVINLSLGRPVFQSYVTDPLCQAVQKAWQAGIVVVVAAGNDGRDNSAGTDGYATINAPGNSPYVITVGAMNTVGTPSRADDKVTSYSSKGPTLLDHVVKPDLVAPGNRIFSLRDNASFLDNSYTANRVPVNAYSTDTSTSTPDYYQLSGTSMAAPMVSGAVALVLQQTPSLTPDQVKARLMKTAAKLPLTSTISYDAETGIAMTSQNDVFTVGAGYMDVKAALASTDVAAGTALSPIAVYDIVAGSAYFLGDSGAIWGGTATWDMSAVWGSSAVWGGRTLTGRTTIWGTAAVWGNAAVWGGGSSYGFSAVWGSSAVWGGVRARDSVIDALNVEIDGEN